MSTTTTYIAVERIEHNRETYLPGQPIKLTDKEAAELRPHGVIAGAVSPSAEAWGFASPPAPDPTPLPADFPARAALVVAGRATLESLAGLTVENLTAIKGIGEATAQAILDAFLDATLKA